VEKIVARAESQFNQPVIGVVGGLHYMGLSEKEIRPRIDFLQPLNLKLVALSPHDSDPQAIEMFREAFADAHHYLKVGSEIQFP
jgi:7,8-dihydropterin-6-yl-methyl-4-(beta-D-ribofuranosyl)aminobenzene 5'-phosphate synthase